MMNVGGQGNWSTIEALLSPIQPPRMVRVKQRFPHPPAVDVAAEIKRQFEEKNTWKIFVGSVLIAIFAREMITFYH